LIILKEEKKGKLSKEKYRSALIQMKKLGIKHDPFARKIIKHKNV